MATKNSSSDYGLPDGFLNTLRAELAGKSNEKNPNDENANKVLAELDRLGKITVKDDSIRFEGSNIVLPEQFAGDLLGAADFLKQLYKQDEEEFSFGRTFNFRPWDGAAAFQRALYRVFGTVGLGKATQTMFGKIPPKLLTIQVSPTETLQVPWGEVSMPILNAVFDLDTDYSEEYGLLFRVNVTAPRKQRARLEAFFTVVEDELKQRSIYKGKAFNGAEQPEFLDLAGIKEEEIVYSDEVMAQLEANLWGLIKHTDVMRELNIPLKRTVLLEGPFGTGKSMAGAITAKRAIENGWTFIIARPGKDNVFDVLNTAKLYAPAVVQFEDIDTIAKGGSDMEISRLLDALDGISNKTSGVLALFTTNYVEKLQKGVMRPGRIDSIIHVADLDRNGTERLIRANVSPKILSPNVDYDVVFAEVHGFLPAFIKETVGRAVRYAVARTGGSVFTIETDDIVNAAQGLRHQLDLMNAAQDGAPKAVTVDTLFRKMVGDAVRETAPTIVDDVVDGTRLYDEDGDYAGKLRT